MMVPISNFWTQNQASFDVSSFVVSLICIKAPPPMFDFDFRFLNLNTITNTIITKCCNVWALHFWWTTPVVSERTRQIFTWQGEPTLTFRRLDHKDRNSLTYVFRDCKLIGASFGQPLSRKHGRFRFLTFLSVWEHPNNG